jgi:epoxide hydrolase-like predicted phosphatase
MVGFFRVKALDARKEIMALIKAIVWDIGGVLMRTEDPTPRAELAAELGLRREELVELVFGGKQGRQAQIGALTQKELWDFVRSELKLESDDYPDLERRFFGGDILDRKLVDFVRTLKPAYKTGIISNAWSELPDILEEWGILDAFDVVVGSGDEGVMKPDPRIFQIALDQLSVAPEESVFVDDFIENVESARNLGMQAVHFESREQTLRELQKLLNI